MACIWAYEHVESSSFVQGLMCCVFCVVFSIYVGLFFFFFYFYGDHRVLHLLTHSFPTRRSSDLVLETSHESDRRLPTIRLVDPAMDFFEPVCAASHPRGSALERRI